MGALAKLFERLLKAKSWILVENEDADYEILYVDMEDGSKLRATRLGNRYTLNLFEDPRDLEDIFNEEMENPDTVVNKVSKFRNFIYPD